MIQDGMISTGYGCTAPVAGAYCPAAVTINYLGVVAWGLGGTAVGALVGAMLCALVKRPWPVRALHLFGAWAITGNLLAGSYYTRNLWPW